jgi:hypothetical protein
VIRLRDDITKEDRRLMEEQVLPRDGSDGALDDLFLQLAKFAATISPQNSLADILHYHFEAISPHMFRFAQILLDRYYASSCTAKLKDYVKSADVCHFLLPLTGGFASLQGLAQIYQRTLFAYPESIDLVSFRERTIKFIRQEPGPDGSFQEISPTS